MKRISKVLVVALVMLFALTVALGAAPKKPPVVGISTGSSGTSWRNIMIDALVSVGNEYKAAGKIADYKLVNNVTNGDATEQANIIRDFTSQGVDVIMVNPNSPDALNGVIKEAQEAGILVVAFDATVTAPRRRERDPRSLRLEHEERRVHLLDAEEGQRDPGVRSGRAPREQRPHQGHRGCHEEIPGHKAHREHLRATGTRPRPRR